MKKVKRDIFLKQMLNILKSYIIFTKIYYFYKQEKKLTNVKSLLVVQKANKNMFFI